MGMLKIPIIIMEIFQISIVLDGYDISEAVDKSTAILIDPEKGVMVNLNCSLISDDTVSLDDLKITFRIADFDIFSRARILPMFSPYLCWYL